MPLAGIALIAALLSLVLLALGIRALRPGFRAVETDLAGTEVTTADGVPTRLGALVDRPALLVMVRYYG
jgi:hypothetical protein